MSEPRLPEGELRGWPIEWDGQKYIYIDTGEPTVGNRRSCGYCKLADTIKGHDGCLGTLPGVLNACCGHGTPDEAYVQFPNGALRGPEALRWMQWRPLCPETLRWCALAWWDRTVDDSRPGCCSALILEGEHGFENMVATLLARFPKIHARRPLTQWAGKTVKEAGRR